MKAVEQLELIVAPATPGGRSALAVVRLSGRGAWRLASSLLEGGKLPPPRVSGLRWLTDEGGRRIDQLICVAYPVGSSYTGEELVELNLHGNPVLVHEVCRLACLGGARMARAGEFTRRAFLSGRLSLVQAEAVAQLIDAPTAAAARAAARNVGGALGLKVGSLRDQLLQILAELEAAIDHPEEELDLATERARGRQLSAVVDAIGRLRASFGASHELFRLPRIVLSGPVNAGKSTLFNTLSGTNRAITSGEPGTTRDLLEIVASWPDRDVLLIDGAGLRADPRDAAEEEGQRRVAQAREEADLVLELWPWDERHQAPSEPRGLRVWTQTRGRAVGQLDDGSVAISALEDLGLEVLATQVADLLGQKDLDEVLVTTLRQEQALGLAQSALLEVRHWAETGEEPVLVAEALHAALQGLGEVLRPCDREDVLDEVFTRFCIGK